MPYLSTMTKTFEFCVPNPRNQDGDDLRSFPLSLRKTNLARLLARRPDGIFLARFEQGEKLARTCFARPATWDWKDWFRSAGIVRTMRAGIGAFA